MKRVKCCFNCSWYQTIPERSMCVLDENNKDIKPDTICEKHERDE